MKLNTFVCLFPLITLSFSKWFSPSRLKALLFLGKNHYQKDGKRIFILKKIPFLLTRKEKSITVEILPSTAVGNTEKKKLISPFYILSKFVSNIETIVFYNLSYNVKTYAQLLDIRKKMSQAKRFLVASCKIEHCSFIQLLSDYKYLCFHFENNTIPQTELLPLFYSLPADLQEFAFISNVTPTRTQASIRFPDKFSSLNNIKKLTVENISDNEEIICNWVEFILQLPHLESLSLSEELMRILFKNINLPSLSPNCEYLAFVNCHNDAILYANSAVGSKLPNLRQLELGSMSITEKRRFAKFCKAFPASQA